MIIASDPAVFAGFETDIPLVIQGFVLIALAVLTFWDQRRQAATRLKSDEEENRHDEHMAKLIVDALKEGEDETSTTPEEKG